MFHVLLCESMTACCSELWTFLYLPNQAHGSCLGMVVFCSRSTPASDLTSLKKDLPNVHCSADETQLYLAFTQNTPGQTFSTSCADASMAFVTRWLLLLKRTDFLKHLAIKSCEKMILKNI